MLMKSILIAVVLMVVGLAFWWSVRSREFRKFLAGAFFVSAGIQAYLAIAHVSVPVLGTTIVQTPQLSMIRAILHGVLFVVSFYFGFLYKKTNTPSRG